MTRNAKIMFIVGAVITVVGILVCIAGHVTAGASVKIGFEIDGETSGTMSVGENSGGLGFSIHIRASELSSCESVFSATTVKDSIDADVAVLNFCSSASVTSDWENNNDPPLVHMGSFGLNPDPDTPDDSTLKVRGTYTVESSTQVWVVDSGEELGEAVGGILAAGAVFLVGLIVAFVGAILCCVGCCCMCTS